MVVEDLQLHTSDPTPMRESASSAVRSTEPPDTMIDARELRSLRLTGSPEHGLDRNRATDFGVVRGAVTGESYVTALEETRTPHARP